MEYTCIRPSAGEIKYNAIRVDLPRAKHSRSHKQEYKLCWKGRPCFYYLWEFKIGDIENTGYFPYKGLWHIIP